MPNLIRVTTTFTFIDEKGKETVLASVDKDVDGETAAAAIIAAASGAAVPMMPPPPPGIPGQTAPIPA